LEKSEFPVSPEIDYSHRLRGDKNVIILTTADHDCVQVPFAACTRSSCHHCICAWFVIKRFVLRWLETVFCFFSKVIELGPIIRAWSCSLLNGCAIFFKVTLHCSFYCV